MNSFVLLQYEKIFTFNVNAQVDLVDEMNKTPLEGHRKRKRRKSMAVRNSHLLSLVSGRTRGIVSRQQVNPFSSTDSDPKEPIT